FFLGYAYDYPTGKISRASSGSHEIFAGYAMKLDLGDKNRHKQKSIRFM
ncbi:MAG: type IX secretion system membrane protein PorP/SprF, partial [Paramuribaculum sp.]|nr:type IX secretion system membrane protein PorP/SprF [Paramuribaculum sp.]